GQMIAANNMRFVSIQDGMQALPILLEQKPDLIFLDLIMPVANGYEICSQLRRSSLFTNTPVIILTGSDGLVDRVRAKVVGATDFLSKPIVAEKVLGMIRKYIKTQQPAREASSAKVLN
nr:response regulator [Nostocaceae cyanobacterium]